MNDTGTPGEGPESAKELLRSHGLRYSRAREQILELFLGGGGHVSAEGLYQRLRDAGADVSLSTVYLNLNVLKSAGLIQEFRGAGGEALFDHNIEPHYHLICKRSGEVLDLPAIDIDGVPLGRFLKDRIERETGWIVDEPRFELLGVAPSQARSAAGREAGSATPERSHADD